MAAFLDTNVLVYCFDARAPQKHTRANDLVRGLLSGSERVLISTQVAIEFLNWSRRSGADVFAAARHAEALSLFDCLPTTLATVHAAWGLAHAEQLSWFDALIVQAALDAGATRLYSEDLQHGRRYGEAGLEVIDPFAPVPA